ncbi:MAG: phage holin family protein [Acidimicrobiales bacterium]|nr:phage holin family protein [Acidimicrobiales bacterium]
MSAPTTGTSGSRDGRAGAATATTRAPDGFGPPPIGELRDDVSPQHRDEVSEASLGELIKRLTTEMSDLVRGEMELARTELKEEATKAGKAGGMFAGAGYAAALAGLLLAFAAAWGLAEVIPEGFAFLVVGVVVGLVAAVLALAGRSKMRQVNPVPERTIETLKEDAQWARAQVR